MAIVTVSRRPLSHRELQLASRLVVAETVDAAAAQTTFLTGSGNLRASLVGLQAGITITSLTIEVSAVGAGMTHWWHAIFDSTLALVASTADSAASVQSQGLVTLALTSTYTPATSGGYFFAVLGTTGTTMPTIGVGGNAGFSGSGNAIGSGARACWQQAGLSALPNPGVAAASSIYPWIAAT